MEKVASGGSVMVQEKIQEMVQRIVTQFAPDKIVLFGSYARGLAGPDSDVDLLIIKPVAGSTHRRRTGAVDRPCRGQSVPRGSGADKPGRG